MDDLCTLYLVMIPLFVTVEERNLQPLIRFPFWRREGTEKRKRMAKERQVIELCAHFALDESGVPSISLLRNVE